MTVPAGVGTPSAPDPGLTELLADRAQTAFAEPVEAGWPRAARQLGRLAAVRPADPELVGWATAIRLEPHGSNGFPLFGTGDTAETYPALVWNGTRLARSEPGIDWAPLLAALAAVGDADLGRLARAVHAGTAVHSAACTLAGDAGSAIAWPTVGTLGAAAAALLVSQDRDNRALAAGLDLAASLMVLTDPAVHDPRHVGHAAASGASVPALLSAGITPMPGAVAHTVSAATGRPVPAGRAPTRSATGTGPAPDTDPGPGDAVFDPRTRVSDLLQDLR